MALNVPEPAEKWVESENKRRWRKSNTAVMEIKPLYDLKSINQLLYIPNQQLPDNQILQNI